MGLAEYKNNGRVYAVFTCDSCGVPFNDVSEAIITFSEFEGHPINYAIGIYHRVRCDPGSKVQPSSDEFATFMRHLVEDYKLNIK